MIVFGKLDENNIVLNVIVVDQKDTSDENGQIVESIGQAFCESITGWPAAQWVMESEDKKNAIGVGMEWDSVNKIFWTPQPYPSWTLDKDTYYWKPPSSIPDDGKKYIWNEQEKKWKEDEQE